LFCQGDSALSMLQFLKKRGYCLLGIDFWEKIDEDFREWPHADLSCVDDPYKDGEAILQSWKDSEKFAYVLHLPPTL